jgi:hypothetical protein
MDGAACVDAWSAGDGDRVGLSGAWAVGGIAALVFEVVVAAGHACVDAGEVSECWRCPETPPGGGFLRRARQERRG